MDLSVLQMDAAEAAEVAAAADTAGGATEVQSDGVVLTANERSLARGRSLARPQNKGRVNYQYEENADMPFGKFLERCVNSDPPPPTQRNSTMCA
jgi:hypothetical protein